MRLLWFVLALAAPYFAFSVWALESHDCFKLIDYLAPIPPERMFWCGDLMRVLGIGYFIAPIIALGTLGLIAFRWARRRFQASNLHST